MRWLLVLLSCLAVAAPAAADDLAPLFKGAFVSPSRVEKFDAVMAQPYRPRVQESGLDAIWSAVSANTYRRDDSTDPWEPGALWERGGDCEDFALAAIREVEAQHLGRTFFAVMRNHHTGQHHAVAVVETGRGVYVLNNFHKTPRTLARTLRDFGVVYIIETGTGRVWQGPEMWS